MQIRMRIRRRRIAGGTSVATRSAPPDGGAIPRYDVDGQKGTGNVDEAPSCSFVPFERTCDFGSVANIGSAES